MNIQEQINQIKEGNETIELFRDLYFEFKRIEALQEEFKELVSNYFDKYSKSELEPLKIEKRAGKKTYNYNHIDEYKKAKFRLKEIEEKAKAALAYDDLEYIDQETGEIKKYDVPTVKHAKDSIIFKKD